MLAGDRAGVEAILPRLYNHSRYTIVAALAGSYLEEGDVAAAMDALSWLDDAPDRARLMAAIGIAQFRLGDQSGGRQTLERAEALALQAEDQRNGQRGPLAIVQALAAIGDSTAARNLLTERYRAARNAGLDRSRLHSYEQSFIDLGDVDSANEVLTQLDSDSDRVLYMIGFAYGSASHGEFSLAAEFIQRSVAILLADRPDSEARPRVPLYQMQLTAQIQADNGRREDASATLKATIRIADDLEEHLTNTGIDHPVPWGTLQLARARTLVQLAELTGDTDRYNDALAATNGIAIWYRLDGIRRIALSLAENGYGSLSEALFAEALELAEIEGYDLYNQPVFFELIASADAAGFEQLAPVWQRVALLGHAVSDEPADPHLIALSSQLLVNVEDIDAVLSALQNFHADARDFSFGAYDAESTVKLATNLAESLARSGRLEDAYRVVEFGVSTVKEISDPGRQATALVTLALSPEYSATDLPNSLPIGDIEIPDYPPM